MKFCFYGNLSQTLLGNPIGGGELQIAYLAKELSLQDHQVIVIDFSCDEHIYYNNNLKLISLKRVSNKKSKIIKYIYFYKLLKEINADVYHCRIRGWIHILAYWVAKKNNKLFTISLASDLDVASFKDRVKYFYKHKGFKYFLLNDLVTEFVYPFLLRKSSWVFCQNILQKEKLDKLGIKNTLLRNILIIDNIEKDNKLLNKDNYFSYVGSFDKRKGFDVLLILAKAVSNINIIAVGEFRTGNLKSHKIPQNVILMGKLSHEKTLNIIRKSKALIHTSLVEGFPNVFLEAWANGVPVISYAVDPDNLLKEHNFGIYCEKDFKKLVRAVQEFDENKFSSSKILDYVSLNHNKDYIVKIFLATIEKIRDTIKK